MKNKWIWIVVLLVFSFGCVGEELDAGTKKMIKELKPKNFNLNSGDDIQDYPPGVCMAMVCKRKIPIFPFSLFFDNSLVNGKCEFKECDETCYSEYAKLGKEEEIRLFMFGAGHSFLSFSDANLYCNNSMKMSVKWLAGSEYTKYPIPQRSRAECLLDKNIIPVYILYSNSKNIDAERAGKIAENLNSAGPVILVSESELDNSNPAHYALVKKQIIAMKTNCPDCLIALGLKLNKTSEYAVTEALFSDPEILEKVDLVAYGLNSHYFEECNPDVLYFYAINLSRTVLYKYNKPSLITYVLFDQAGGLGNKCTWSEKNVGNGYSLLYKYVKTLVSNGIIGASLYSFYGTGPLKCKNCAFVDLTNDLTKIEPRFTNYMGSCQAYYGGFGDRMSGIVPVVFSTGSKNCNYAVNTNMDAYIKPTIEEIKPLVPGEVTKADPFFTCAGCFASSVKLLENLPSIAGSKEKCKFYSPEIEIAADNFDMDPVLLRAAAWQESNFEKCAVSYLPVSRTTCNTKNLLNVEDPDETCIETKKYYANPESTNLVSPCEVEGSFVSNLPQEQCKPCAYGLIQTIIYPAEIYRKNNMEIPETAHVCGGITEKGVDFNPFRPYDSACAYAYEFMNEKLPKSRNRVNNNLAALGLESSDSEYKDKIELYAMFFALDLSFGHQKNGCGSESLSQQDWIDDFAEQKDREDCDEKPVLCNGVKRTACCGEKDFLSYVKNCKHGGGFSYAYDVLKKYKWLAENCEEISCPDNNNADKNIIKYGCETKNIDEVCCAAARGILGYYSASKLCSNPPIGCEKYCK